MHQDPRRLIEDDLDSASSPTVVVIHNLPHAASLPDRFKGICSTPPTRPT